MKRIILPFLASILFWACTENEELSCDEKVCTMQFESVKVKFIDADGNALVVKDFSAYNSRTKKPISNLNTSLDTIYQKGYYEIANDLNKSELSPEGDEIIVTAKHPKTNVEKTAKFVVAGSISPCVSCSHISKISGPEIINF